MLKLERTKQTARATVFVTLCWFCYCYCACGDSLSLRNYDNDPILAKAIEYDLEQNGADYEKADRAKAEQYYLAYVESANDPFQKARVYASLGALYAVAINERLGEKPDYEKARMYFKKVLELEPERIAYPTIRARTMRASMQESGSARVMARMDVYEWVRSIDEDKMRQLWLPLTPTDDGPKDLVLRSTRNLQASLKSTLQTNIMGGIKYLPDKEAKAFLLEITDRFAGSELDRLARQHAAEREISIPDKPTTKRAEPKAQTPGPVPATLAGDNWTPALYFLAAAVVTVKLIVPFL